MSQLLREALAGFIGTTIKESLRVVANRMDEQTLKMVRDGSKPYEQARYTAGVADGVRLALNTIKELGKQE